MTLSARTLFRLAEQTGDRRLLQLADELGTYYPALVDDGRRSTASTLLVATSQGETGRAATLLGYPAPAGTEGLPFFAEAALAHATSAELARLLQLRSQKSGPAPREPGTAWLLAHQGSSSPPKRLDGTSFGAAFFLVTFARLAGLTIPSRCVALAQVEPSGHLAPVSDLDAKISMLVGEAPGVCDIVVASKQAGISEDVASLLEERAITLHRAGSVAQLATLVFGASIYEQLKPKEVNALVERLFLATIGSVQHQAVWPAADVLLKTISQMPRDSAVEPKFRFVRAVADRRTMQGHSTKPLYDGGLAEAEFLHSLPRETALLVCANLAQHLASYPQTGEVEDVLAAANAILDPSQPLHQASTAELKLHGAMARLELTQNGSEEHAFQRNVEVAEAWLRLRPDEASFQICQLFRIAALTQAPSKERLRRAQDLTERWDQAGGWSGRASSHIRFEAARACLALDRGFNGPSWLVVKQSDAQASLAEMLRDPAGEGVVRRATALFLQIGALLQSDDERVDEYWLSLAPTDGAPDRNELSAAAKLWAALLRQPALTSNESVTIAPLLDACSARLRDWMNHPGAGSLRRRLQLAAWGW